jgi:hypothetical protein
MISKISILICLIGLIQSSPIEEKQIPAVVVPPFVGAGVLPNGAVFPAFPVHPGFFVVPEKG